MPYGKWLCKFNNYHDDDRSCSCEAQITKAYEEGWSDYVLTNTKNNPYDKSSDEYESYEEGFDDAKIYNNNHWSNY
jgi:hypothetical protein